MLLRLDGEGPLYEQATRALRTAILAGVLQPGSRLPATRTLARDLGLSRNTVLQAYERLLDEGYVVARTGSGTYVASTLPDEHVTVASPARVDEGKQARRSPRSAAGVSRHAERMVESAPRGAVSWGMPRRSLPYDFRYGEPAYADLPLETWWRMLGRRARRASAARLAYGGPAGSPELRTALASYLRRARGVVCEPEQIVLTHGSQQAIDLVARVLVDAGDCVAVEEPHYTGFSLALDAYGADRVGIEVDEQGLRVEELSTGAGRPDARRIRGVFTTPSHQFPAGAVLSLERRLALLSWAERTGAFVVEDDYDGEFRYEGRPVPSLQGLDRAGTVIYIGTASKVLFPSLRIGWMVVPESLTRPFTLAKAYSDTGSATLEQLVLADFIEGGHLDRHVRRARARNGARRDALQAAVVRHLGGAAELVGTRAGVHGLLRMRDIAGSREAELRRRCEARGVGLYPAAPYYTNPPRRASYVLGYAALTEEMIETGVRRIAESLADM